MLKTLWPIVLLVVIVTVGMYAASHYSSTDVTEDVPQDAANVAAPVEERAGEVEGVPPQEEGLKDTASAEEKVTPADTAQTAVPATTMPKKEVPQTPAAHTQIETVVSPTLTLPYNTIILSIPYSIGWHATKGTQATIELIKNGTVVNVVNGCKDMPVTPEKVSYCTWTQQPPDRLLGTTNFTLKLVVKDSAGRTVATEESQSLSFVPRSSFTLTEHRNNMFGWAVWYPENWFVKREDTKTIIARDAEGLISPLSKHEAFVIEYCSTARVSCVQRVEEYLRQSGIYESVLGGKRSKARVYSEGGMYVRQDMLEQNGIVFFVSRRALDAQGTVRSPYVRESIAQFGHKPARVSIETFALNESYRSGGLLIEYLDSGISFVRLYTGATGCFTEVTSSTFSEAYSGGFQFTKNGCTTEAERSSHNTYSIEEHDCELFHTGECSFDGDYELVQ